MNITVKDLLDAGVHFGHQRKRWNPKSKGFVYDHRHGISIIDLEKSFQSLEKAVDYVTETVADGGEILMVGTKRQAQEMIREVANATQMPFCANRWLGGTLTNYETIKRSVSKFKKYQEMESDGSLGKLPKKEGAAVKREMARMQRNFEGIQDMKSLPNALFVIDVKAEEIAVAEARRLEIPIVALVDTNSDPTVVDYPIPGNDDAVKSIRIILEVVMEAIQDGLNQREARRASKPISINVEGMPGARQDDDRASHDDDVTIEGEALGTAMQHEAMERESAQEKAAASRVEAPEPTPEETAESQPAESDDTKAESSESKEDETNEDEESRK